MHQPCADDLAMKCVDSAQTIMHNWWMDAVAARIGKIVYIDEPFCDYRQPDTNSVGAKTVHNIFSICFCIVRRSEIRRQRKGAGACF